MNQGHHNTMQDREKFLNFLEAAETNATSRAGIPAFVAEIKTIFEPWH